jgi:hypothetical protein
MHLIFDYPKSLLIKTICLPLFILTPSIFFGQPINYTTPYTISTLAGQLVNGNGYADGTSSNATFYKPYGIAVDSSGNTYVADSYNYCVRKITPAGITSTIAGTPSISGNVNGIGTSAQFGQLAGIAIDLSGNIFVSDLTYNTLRKITLSGTTYTVSTLVNQTQGLNQPIGLALDSLGNLYIADSMNMVIRKVTPTGLLSTFAGTIGHLGGTDGAGSNASFGGPVGIAIDSNNNLYVVDNSASTLRQITPSALVTTLGGYYGSPGIVDGALSTNVSQFNHPSAIACDYQNNLFIIDGSSSSYIRKISQINVTNGVISGTVSTIAGSSISGSSDGTGSLAKFSNALGIAVDSAGNIYVSNTGSSTIRKGILAPLNTPPSITTNPTNTVGYPGFTVTLSVNASGTAPLIYQWYYNGIALSNSSNISGVNSANLSISNFSSASAGQYYVTVTNTYGSVNSSIASVSTPTPSILIQPQSQTATVGGSATFSTVASGSGLSYQWYLNGNIINGATNASYTISNIQSTNFGIYTVVVTNSYGSTTSTNAFLSSGTNPGRLINLSVLTLDGPGNQLLSVGFVTGGAGTVGSQNLLIRANGPSLTTYGVSNTLADPILNLLSGSKVLATNDNWASTVLNQTQVTAADAATGAFPLNDPSSLDAALVITLPTNPGYTVQVSGKNNSSGNALAEIYDNTPSGTYTVTTPRLINVSCLQQVINQGTLSAGFTIGGATQETVLIRASGPAIALFGVPGAMADPMLSVYSGTTVIASNAGWGSPTSNQIAVASAESLTGAFAYTNSASHDSALVLTLQPGQYTIQAKSASGAAGSTLIEVYEVPNN